AETTQLGDQLFRILNAAERYLISACSTVGVCSRWPWRNHDGLGLLAISQCLPQNFRHERHGWVQQAKNYIKNAPQNHLGVASGSRYAIPCNLRLSNFQIPVTQLVPCEVVKQLIRASKLVIIQVSIHAHAHVFGAIENPPVSIGQLIAIRQSIDASAIHQRNLRGVEQFRGKVACRSCRVAAQRQVRAWVSTASKRKAQRISTVITHPVHWVNAVAQRLRHLTAMLITHQTVQIEIPERNLWAAFCPLPQQLWGLSSSESSEHHHARYPEEDNVVAGNQNVSWVELL